MQAGLMHLLALAQGADLLCLCCGQAVLQRGQVQLIEARSGDSDGVNLQLRAPPRCCCCSLSTFNSSAFPRSFSASALSSPASAARYTSTRSASCARLASSALTSLLTLLTLSSSIFILLMACCSASSLSRAADTRGMSTSRRATNFVSVSLSSRWCDSSKSDPEAAAALALLAVPRAELRSPG